MRWLSGNRADVEDAMGDVYCRASHTFAQGDPGIVNARAWLRRLLHNRCMDIHRRRRFIDQNANTSSEESEQDLPEHGESASPEELLLNEELRRVLDEALRQLPDQLRGPVMMRLIDGESYEAIAASYRISLANARKRIQLARAELRDRLSRYLSGESGPPPMMPAAPPCPPAPPNQPPPMVRKAAPAPAPKPPKPSGGTLRVRVSVRIG